MAAMPREAVNDALELGGALATGAGLHWFSRSRQADDIVPIVASLGVSAVGTFAAMSLQGPVAFLAEGAAVAGAAYSGVRLVDMFQAQKGTQFGRWRRYGSAYRTAAYTGYTPVYTGGGSNAVIEI